MAILWCGKSDYMIPIGSIVRSVKVGSRAAFNGIVTEYIGVCYHVQDENGDGWNRDRKELHLIQGPDIGQA